MYILFTSQEMSFPQCFNRFARPSLANRITTIPRIHCWYTKKAWQLDRPSGGRGYLRHTMLRIWRTLREETTRTLGTITEHLSCRLPLSVVSEHIQNTGTENTPTIDFCNSFLPSLVASHFLYFFGQFAYFCVDSVLIAFLCSLVDS